MATGIARRVVPGQSPPAGMSMTINKKCAWVNPGIEVSRTMAMNNGNKLPVVFSEIEKAPICPNAPKLSSECGIIVRGLAPLQHQSWTKIPEHYRSALIERIKDKFVVDTTVPFIRKYLNDNMASKFTNHRNKLVKHFKSFGTIEEALLNPPRNVSQDSWNYLCDWFSSETFQKRSRAGSNNRAKVPYNHCGGSLPFVVHRELKKAQEVQLVYIQTFYDTHTHMVKNSDDENEVQWISKEAQIRHVSVSTRNCRGSQPHEELDIFNEVIGAKRYKRQRVSSASSSNGVVNEFRDMIETLNEKIKSQEDQILKYQDEIKEMKDENQKMKDDNAAFKEDMLSRLGFAPAMLNNLPIPPQEHN
ncbi:hypothetical protein MKW92_040239 [Papaver armeniacum]|nr:hypothetical protein MKW92_040239 [Papaver armeniacum]